MQSVRAVFHTKRQNFFSKVRKIKQTKLIHKEAMTSCHAKRDKQNTILPITVKTKPRDTTLNYQIIALDDNIDCRTTLLLTRGVYPPKLLMAQFLLKFLFGAKVSQRDPGTVGNRNQK